MTEKKKSEPTVEENSGNSFADVLSEASGLTKDEVQEIVDENTEASKDSEEEIPAEGPNEDTDLDDNETGLMELDTPDETPQGSRVHTVTGGQTLRQIAGHYGVEYGTLLKLNPQLKNPRHLVRGQEIKIDG